MTAQPGMAMPALSNRQEGLTGMDPVTMTQEEYEARTAEEPYARTRTQGSQSADPEL